MPDGPISTPPDPENFELRKEIVIAHAGKNFRNGKVWFDLTTAQIDKMIENFVRLKRQVKIFLSLEVPDGDHQFNADLPATGWVEGMRRVGNDWLASVKLHGNGAAVVKNDEMRGISVGTMRGRDTHGKPTGEFLDHLLITNVPFFADLNIAASDKQADSRVSYITACAHTEADMADDKKLALQEDEDEEKKEETRKMAEGDEDEDEDVVPEEEFTLANYKKLRKMVRKFQSLQLSLQADNETLKEQLSAKSGLANMDKEKLAIRLKRLETERDAQNVREIVGEGLSRLTLKGAWTKGYKGEEDDGGRGTLDWLLSSRFADPIDPTNTRAALRTLKYQAFKTDPIALLNKDYTAGQVKADSLTLTQDEHELVRKLGITPEQLKAGLKASSADDMKAFTTKKES